MKVKIAGIEVEVQSVEQITVPVKYALPFHMYPAGTKRGFYCCACEQECILAPSGQQIVSAGQNPILCADCFRVSLKPQA